MAMFEVTFDFVAQQNLEQGNEGETHNVESKFKHWSFEIFVLEHRSNENDEDEVGVEAAGYEQRRENNPVRHEADLMNLQREHYQGSQQ